MSSPRLPEVLGAYAASDAARFHMPGHKGFGLPIPPAWDVTEIQGTDNLHDPTGPILRTEEAFAEACGAKACFLLVNGSTAGNLAMLLSLGEGKRVLFHRDAHRSAVSGLALGGHEAIPLFDPSPARVEAALEEAGGSIDAVFVVSPDYYGRCLDLPAIARAAHGHGAKLLVDAAHGAHFPFSRRLPELHGDCVDMFTLSAHKTLNAMTQSAVLCLGQGAREEARDIRRMLALVESSSPSYPLMASLDWALHTARGGAWERQVDRALALREEIGRINGLSLLPNGDPTRVVVNVEGRGISGPQAARALLDMNVVPEMADGTSLILITTPSDPDVWYERLLSALKKLPYGTGAKTLPQRPSLPAPAPTLPLRQALLGAAEPVPLPLCAGRIAAAPAGLYPPGTALLFPGEAIAEEWAAYMEGMARAGLSLFGAQGGAVLCVKERN